jgi:beta-N-acetylhexosaminidase
VPAKRRRVAIALLAALAAAAGVAGALVGANHEDESAQKVPPANRVAPRARVSFLTRIVPPPAGRERRGSGPAVPRGVTAPARRLSLERKVAQLFLLGFRGTGRNAEIFHRLRRLDLGGIVLAGPNYVDASTLGAVTGAARSVARRARHVPPWVMAIQEGGDLNSFPDLPPANAPADVASINEAGAQAAEAAKALRDVGITGILGPVVDVGIPTGSALGARVYSDDPSEVARYADATVTAYRRGRLFSAVEHFPGLGAADQSTQEGPANVGLGVAELRDRDLIPFRAAIDHGVPGVVIGHALYPFTGFTVPASLSRAVETGLLRGDLDFKGVAITDDLADPAVTAVYSVPDAAVRAVRAGADALFISGPAGDQQAAYVAVLRAVRGGRIPRSRLDQAIGRILLAKKRYGLVR